MTNLLPAVGLSLAWACLTTTHSLAASPSCPSSLEAYNVIWTTPSKDASGSMPIGNGETGLNVWVEEDGDLLFYIARTDAWSEVSRLLKLGRVRVQLSPNPFARGLPFRQELKLRHGLIELTAGPIGQETRLTLFVDAEADVIHLVGRSDQGLKVRVSLENWRPREKELKGDELQSSWTMQEAPPGTDLRESADVIQTSPDSVTWYHLNERSIVPLTLKHQGLEEHAHHVPDPLLHRIFGGLIEAPGFASTPVQNGAELATASLVSRQDIRDFAVRIATRSTIERSVETWKKDLGKLAARSKHKAAQQRTTEWWEAFWDRSWVFIEGDSPGNPLAKNSHPLRFGTDSTGNNRFGGRLSRAGVFGRALDDAEVAALGSGKVWEQVTIPSGLLAGWGAPDGVAEAKPAGTQAPAIESDLPATRLTSGYIEVLPATVDLSKGFTVEAWINPDRGVESARLFDKLTAGVNDGFLFDIHPKGSLRLIVGDLLLSAPNAVRPSQWQHVAARFDAASGAAAIFLNGRRVASSQGSSETLKGSPVTRGYILQRWMTAGAGRGNYPIKFNGSIFTVDPEFTGGPKLNADWRRWGDCFWWQNTRLPYFPMIARGDFDQLAPLFNFYQGFVPLAKARTQSYFGCEGLHFPETATIFGTPGNRDYGWNRSGLNRAEMVNEYIRHIWQQGLEYCELMLDYYDHTGDRRFLRDTLIPTANDALRYYLTRFKRDAQGKLLITPTQSVETYWYEVVNDTPSVAGLNSVVARLLALSPALTTREDRAFWEQVNSATPTVPIEKSASSSRILPAERFNPKRSNVENPELYAVWPFRLFGVGRPEVETGRVTFQKRHEKSTVGWSYDAHCAAYLGLAEEAARQLARKAANSHPGHRFPAMWGPNYDWLPDQDHGSCLMLTLQTMLIQPVGDKIYLLPAWPKDWSASFKLHAPNRTTIEGRVRDGKLVLDRVTPEERRKDVVIAESFL